MARASASLFAGLLLSCTYLLAAEPARPIRVVVWDEQQPAQKQAYENFLGNEIASFLKQRPGLDVKSVRLDDPELATVDAIRPEKYAQPKRDARLTPNVEKIVQPDGKIVLKVQLPNCCFPAYRGDGKPSHVRTLLSHHPIAAGVPAQFDIPHTEMYDEPFHVPAPDEVIFEERWDAGERFRSGAVWKIGQGRLFYFRPGHETFDVFKQPETLQIIENAVRWLGTPETDSRAK